MGEPGDAELRAMLPALRCDVRAMAGASGALQATLPALTADAGAALGSPGNLIAALPALRFAAQASSTHAITLAARFPTLAVRTTARYQSYAVRPVVGSHASPWQYGRAHTTGAQARHESTAHESAPVHSLWQGARIRIDGIESRLAGVLVRSRMSVTARHQGGTAVARRSSARHEDAVRLRAARAVAFESAVRGEWLRRAIGHQDGWRDRHHAAASGYQEALRYAGYIQREGIQSAIARPRRWISFWQPAMRPLPGRHRPPTFEPPATPPCYVPSAHLLFAESPALDGHLLFACEPIAKPISGSIWVPPRKVYVVINDVTLVRWPDGTPVPVLSLSLSLDADSWAWGFEATLPTMAEPLIVPAVGAAPVELIATVNGTAFHVLAENLSRERAFGEASIRISGRGRSATLAAPYAPVIAFANTAPRSARQLMDDVLTFNGVPLGWTVDWALTDWPVPAGVFTRQGTWIEALTDIAHAAGGYVLPHPTEQTLRVRHRYPVAPWDWWDEVTPDIVLPADAVARESLRWIDKPAYNRVFVAGQDVGVLGQVTRSGTAGNVLAPMLVDPLITDAVAARQRGLAVLADTGRKIEVGLRLPVLPETGIIEPGAFVAYQEDGVARLGIVRSTRIEAGLPEVWQTLGVESHA